MSTDHTAPVWPEWSSAEQELVVLRHALHLAVRDRLLATSVPDWVFQEEQAYVDYYVSMARGAG